MKVERPAWYSEIRRRMAPPNLRESGPMSTKAPTKSNTKTEKQSTETPTTTPTAPIEAVPAPVEAEATPVEAEAPEGMGNVTNISDADLVAMLKALRAEQRRRDAQRESLRPKAGSKVRILRGRPKYVGKVGTAVIVRKSRCFVTVPEINAPAYVLISDLELVE